MTYRKFTNIYILFLFFIISFGIFVLPVSWLFFGILYFFCFASLTDHRYVYPLTARTRLNLPSHTGRQQISGSVFMNRLSVCHYGALDREPLFGSGWN